MKEEKQKDKPAFNTIVCSKTKTREIKNIVQFLNEFLLVN